MWPFVLIEWVQNVISSFTAICSCYWTPIQSMLQRFLTKPQLNCPGISPWSINQEANPQNRCRVKWVQLSFIKSQNSTCFRLSWVALQNCSRWGSFFKAWQEHVGEGHVAFKDYNGFSLTQCQSWKVSAMDMVDANGQQRILQWKKKKTKHTHKQKLHMDVPWMRGNKLVLKNKK